MNDGSPPLQLNKNDMSKVLKGLLIALGGAGLTYLSSIVGQIDYGNYAIIVYPLLSALLNAAIKWVSDNRAQG